MRKTPAGETRLHACTGGLRCSGGPLVIWKLIAIYEAIFASGASEEKYGYIDDICLFKMIYRVTLSLGTHPRRPQSIRYVQTTRPSRTRSPHTSRTRSPHTSRTRSPHHTPHERLLSACFVSGRWRPALIILGVYRICFRKPVFATHSASMRTQRAL